MFTSICLSILRPYTRNSTLIFYAIQVLLLFHYISEAYLWTQNNDLNIIQNDYVFIQRGIHEFLNLVWNIFHIKTLHFLGLARNLFLIWNKVIQKLQSLMLKLMITLLITS